MFSYYFASYLPHAFDQEKLQKFLREKEIELAEIQVQLELPSFLFKPLSWEENAPLTGTVFPKKGVEGFGLNAWLGKHYPKPFLFITGLYLVTYEQEDCRDHGRTFVVYDDVISVSTWGILEAPAKDKLFYIAYQARKATGMDEERAYREALALSPGFLPETPLFEQALFFTVLQAIFFHQTLAPPCHDKTCLFFIARKQKELERQSEKIFLCAFHRSFFSSFKSKI